MGNETEQIKERLDVADIVGEYVSLKRAGAHFKGLCPFHQEKTPSFIVSPEKGIWHCFGCNSGGDVFEFVKRIEGVDFPEALKLLAERAGVTLQATHLRPGFGEAKPGRQRLFDVLKTAARFYHTLLVQHESGKQAKAYLAQRGVQEKTMREFEIGYAPMRWDTIQQCLQKKGFTIHEIVQAGLAGKAQQGKFYDRFRGRIIFPITDLQGRVVAFGGRIVPWHATGEEGKYINSPETVLYEKRRVVYNLSRAKAHLRHGEPAIVVEGYMDVIMLHQAGVKQVVASSGTAFTAEHIQALARYTNTLHFAFDADAAGSKATVAATEAALSAGMRVATIVMPAGEDPADVALKHSQEVRAIFSQPRSLLVELLDQLTSEKETRNRETQLEVLLPLLARVRNPILKGEMVQEVATTLAIPATDVLRLLERTSRPQARDAALPLEEHTQPSGSQAERALLGILVISSSARELIWEKLHSELFVDENMRELYNTMHTIARSIMEWTHLREEDVVAALPPAQQSLVQAVSAIGSDIISRSSESVTKEAEVILRSLKRRYLAAYLQDIQRTLASVSDEEKQSVLQQFQGVAEELAAVTAQEA